MDQAPHRPTRPGQPVPTASPQTRRLYAGDWRHFTAWCRTNRHPTLPTTADALTAYMLATAAALGRGARGRRLAAIRAMHRQAGLLAPALSPATRAELRRTTAPALAPRATRPDAAALVRMALRCPGDLAGLRDRALLLLAAAAPLPQETLVRLQREHIRLTEPGLVLTLPDSPPLPIAAIPGQPGCPVRALTDWLDASATSYGPVFRKVDRWGNVEHDALGPDGLRRIIARRKSA